MMSTPHPLYVLVDSAKMGQIVVQAGARTVQLRMKNASIAYIRSELITLMAACQPFGAQVVINDHWQLALELGCSWVHLGQEDLDTADIAALKHAGISIGISTHDEAELARALAIVPDYIALGPIFATSTKQVAWAPQGLAKITQWKAKIGDIPLVAIGGITLERAHEVYAAGADSIAVSGDICGHANLAGRLAEWGALTTL